MPWASVLQVKAADLKVLPILVGAAEAQGAVGNCRGCTQLQVAGRRLVFRSPQFPPYSLASHVWLLAVEL